jgi:uncharacterized protein YgbK (DUF1537 family)
LEAMLSALGRPEQPTVAVVCPAFPAQGRGLLDGMLVLAGRQDRSLYLPALIAAETARPVALVPLETVQKGAGALGAAFRTAADQGAQILVVDALNESDLATVVAATQTALFHTLLCGSAGLIEPLARSLITPELAAPRLQPLHVRPPLLAVVGSGSAMAHRQIAALRGDRDLLIMEVDPARDALVELEWIGKRGVVLHLPQPGTDIPLEGEVARSWAAFLAERAARLAEDLQPGLILVVGGDTLVYTLERLGIRQLEVLAELLPGVPLLAGVRDDGERTLIVTKAGSFGDEQTLVRLLAGAFYA